MGEKRLRQAGERRCSPWLRTPKHLFLALSMSFVHYSADENRHCSSLIINEVFRLVVFALEIVTRPRIAI